MTSGCRRGCRRPIASPRFITARTSSAALPTAQRCDQASAELEAFAARMAAERAVASASLGGRVVPVTEQTVRAIRPTLLLIAGSVGCCCSSPAPTRRRCCSPARRTGATSSPSALHSARLARACSRWRLPSRSSSRGSAASPGCSSAVGRSAQCCRCSTGALPAAIPIDIDTRVAVFTAALSGVLGLLFGIIVAVHRPDGRLVDQLKASGRTISGIGGTRAQCARDRARSRSP